MARLCQVTFSSSTIMTIWINPSSQGTFVLLWRKQRHSNSLNIFLKGPHCISLCLLFVGHDSYLKRTSQTYSDSPSQGRVLSIQLPGNLVRTGVILGLSQAANHIARALAASRRKLSGTRFGASMGFTGLGFPCQHPPHWVLQIGCRHGSCWCCFSCSFTAWLRRS